MMLVRIRQPVLKFGGFCFLIKAPRAQVKFTSFLLVGNAFHGTSASAVKYFSLR